MAISISWRDSFQNREVNELHADAFQHRLFDDDWAGQVERFSLGWVTAREDDQLIGFVNVAWDGGVHAFVLDTMVATSHGRQGIATRMVALAVEHGKASGCEWLHVDFDAEHESFYIDSCGFVPTKAGLIALA